MIVMAEFPGKLGNLFLAFYYLQVTSFTSTALGKAIGTGAVNHKNRSSDLDVLLRKALRSVDEEDRRIRDVESALQSIDRETAFHEDRKRDSIARVLSAVEEHTKQALKSAVPQETGSQNSDVILPDLAAGELGDGRTITVDTRAGQKRVFVPKGWVFCTIMPRRCY